MCFIMGSRGLFQQSHMDSRVDHLRQELGIEAGIAVRMKRLERRPASFPHEHVPRLNPHPALLYEQNRTGISHVWGEHPAFSTQGQKDQ